MDQLSVPCYLTKAPRLATTFLVGITVRKYAGLRKKKLQSKRFGMEVSYSR
jgi:hypothetical protein